MGALGFGIGWETGKWGLGKLMGRSDEQIENTTLSTAWDWFSHGGEIDHTGDIRPGEKFNQGAANKGHMDAANRILVHTANGSYDPTMTQGMTPEQIQKAIATPAQGVLGHGVGDGTNKEMLAVLKSIDNKVGGGGGIGGGPPSNDTRTHPLGASRGPAQ